MSPVNPLSTGLSPWSGAVITGMREVCKRRIRQAVAVGASLGPLARGFRMCLLSDDVVPGTRGVKIAITQTIDANHVCG